MGKMLSIAAVAAAMAGAVAAYAMLRAPVPAQFRATEITGVSWGKGFDLRDHAGHRRTLADFRGKAVILSFGYTSCPDTCATTLALLGTAINLMGAEAERVQALFVTLDPGRDTPKVLSRYVSAFHPALLGLRGDSAATDRVAREFQLHHRHNAPAGDGSYTIDHSAPFYVFDPAGRLRLLIRPEAPPESIAHDLRILLQTAN